VFVTVRRTWKVWPTHADAGTRLTAAARAAGVWMVADTVDAESRATDPQVVPVPVAVNTASPAPLADQVQTNVVAVLDGRVTGPGGNGPEIASTNAPPGPTYMVAVTPETVDPPPFDTVNETVIHCPIETLSGTAFNAVHNDPPSVTVTAFDGRGPVVRFAPEFASIPVTVAVRTTFPAALPVKVHVYVADAPPASGPETNGGVDPVSVVAPPPLIPNGIAAFGSWTVFAAACPVLVTVSVTRYDCPVQTEDAYWTTEAAKFAGVWIVVVAVALAATGPHPVVPETVIVKVTTPAPVAV